MSKKHPEPVEIGSLEIGEKFLFYADLVFAEDSADFVPDDFTIFSNNGKGHVSFFGRALKELKVCPPSFLVVPFKESEVWQSPSIKVDHDGTQTVRLYEVGEFEMFEAFGFVFVVINKESNSVVCTCAEYEYFKPKFSRVDATNTSCGAIEFSGNLLVKRISRERYYLENGPRINTKPLNND